jgi:hypothetical protein
VAVSESPDHLAARIEAVIANGDAAVLALPGYRIGDEYETLAAAFSLTVSAEHLVGLRREGDVMRGTAFLPVELVPRSYGDRVNPNGAVPIGIEFALAGAALASPEDSSDFGNTISGLDAPS